MAELGADARGREDHIAAAAAQLEAAAAAANGVVDGSGGGGGGDGVLGREDGEQRDAGSGVEAGAVTLEGGKEMAEQKENICNAKEEALSAEEEKRGYFAVELGHSVEPGDLGTCRVVSAGVENEGSCARRGEEFSSEDAGYVRDTLVEAAERSQGERERLVAMEGNGNVVLEEKINNKSLKTACEEPHGNNVDLLDSRKLDSEGSPCGADGVGSAANANVEEEKDGLLTKVDEEITRPADESSIPSISEGCIDVSVDGKAGRMGTISESNMGMEKSACGSKREDTLFCESDCREDHCAEENQPSSSEISQRVNLLESKEVNREGSEACANGPSDEIKVSLQQTDQEFGCTEYSLERHLSSSFQVQPCEEACHCRGEESSAWHWSHQDSAGLGCAPSGHSLIPEFNRDLSNSRNGKGCFGDFAKDVETGESVNPKPAPLIVFRRRNPKRAASSRNTQNLEKPDQLNRSRNGAGKCKQVVGTSSVLLSTMIKFPNKTTKRRSCLQRQVQYSVWGSLENLIDSFGQNCELSTSDSDPTWLGGERSKKRRSSGGKKQPCIRKSRSSRFSKNMFAVPSDIGHAKNALNAQRTFPVMADTHASLEKDHKEHIPNLVPHASTDISYEVGKPSQSNEDKCIPNLKSVQIDGQQLERDLESTVTQETYSDYIRGECAGLLSSEPSLKIGNGTVMLDPGSSPDSVVYNPVLEAASVTCESNISANHDVVVHESLLVPDVSAEDDLHAAVLCASNSAKNHALDSSVDLEPRDKTEKENKSTKNVEVGPSCGMVGNHLYEGKVQASENHNTVRKSKSLSKHGCKKKDGIKEKNSKSRSSTKVSSRKGSKCRAFSNDSSVFGLSELPVCKGSPKLECCFEASTFSEQDLGTRLHEHDNLERSFLTDNIKGDMITGRVKSKASRHKNKDGHGGRKVKERDSDIKGEKKKSLLGDAFHGLGSSSISSGSAAELAASGLNELRKLSPARELVCKNSATISTELPNEAAYGLGGQSIPPRVAWVCCDDCQKWRCIPAALADVIGETNCRWTCKDNEDKAFADCSIPQEKTNAEINAELELSDASCDEGYNAASNSRACRPPSWAHIRSNLFLHRNRRTQSIDECMVCDCKPPGDGRMGCRGGCLNRILNIECVKRTCPCGDLCSNQKFQRRNYAKLRWFHSGKKGYGLQLQENVSEGQFLIEYVGEVLDITAYESRQRYYASKGQKHFYFMALNGGEVIDACTKGNLGRFINHSCSPNCRTEKWMVNGEVCIGIFAIRNIKKGEELTFDYNYVRVSGAAPQKCFCGSAKCRGYLGGDILGADAIIQGDVEAEYFERLAVDRDAEKELGANEFSSHGTYLDVVEHEETSIQREDSNQCSSSTPELEACQQTGGTLSDISEPDNSLQALSPQEAEDIIRTPVHVSRTMESSVQCLSVPSNEPAEFLRKTSNPVNGSTPISASTGVESNLMSDSHDNKQNKLKCHNNLKSSSPIDNAKNSMATAKTSVLHKDKRMPADTGNEHFLGVEGRLNKLLDSDGGISKRKDATNGYLKLLLVTAAEGDNAGGTSQSVRDISLILDALLKTKSHTVLLDVINKNGLQMLHNILKQNRSNFHRTPIIRKLLKVLEFLALKGILTPEHINRGPRYAGMESFRDSMLSLTRHNDSQVHQIARNFRDKWIPRTITRIEPTEREDVHLHSQRNYFNRFQTPLANGQYDQGRRESDAVVCVNTMAYPPASSSAWEIQGISSAGGPVSTSSCSTVGNSTSRRKRKSRWDQPSDDKSVCQYPHALPTNEDQYEMVGSKFRKACSEHAEFGPRIGFRRIKLQRDGERQGSCNEAPCMRGSTGEHVDEEVPPGFGSPQEGHTPLFPSQISSDEGGVAPGYRQERFQPHLSISYGIPVDLVQHFGTPEAEGSQCRNTWKIAPGMPFHPFPPLPPYPRGEPCPSTSSNQMSQHDDETLAVKQNNSAHYERPADRGGRMHRNWRNGGRVRWSSNYQGRRFPRQWSNHHRFERHWPPWPREHWVSGSRGREGPSSGFGNSSSDIHGNSCSSKL